MAGTLRQIRRRIRSIQSGCVRPRAEARGIVRSPRPRFLAALGMTYHPPCHSEERACRRVGEATRNLVGWPGPAVRERIGGLV